MTADLLVIVPSRGRPQNLVEFGDAWFDTKAANVDLLVALDDDDPTAAAYPLVGHIYVGPRIRLGPTLNKYATELADDYKVIGFMGDDHRPRTDGWDRQILDAAAEIGSGVIYGNDLIQGPNLPTAAFITTDLIRTLGFMCPPGLVHLFLDNWWKKLGENTALRYLPDVVIEHLHPIAGKAEWDEGYREVNAGSQYESDRIAYETYLSGQWPADLAKIRAAA